MHILNSFLAIVDADGLLDHTAICRKRQWLDRKRSDTSIDFEHCITETDVLCQQWYP